MNEGRRDCRPSLQPLGKASELDGYAGKKVVVIGGGLGTAIAYPQAKKLSEIGARVHVIIGFRNKDLIILEEELGRLSEKLVVATDDGSNGNKGFVTDKLKELIRSEYGWEPVIIDQEFLRVELDSHSLDLRRKYLRISEDYKNQIVEIINDFVERRDEYSNYLTKSSKNYSDLHHCNRHK